MPISTPAQGKERPAQTVSVADEGPQADSSLEKLGKLGSGFPGWRQRDGGQFVHAKRRRSGAADRLTSGGGPAGPASPGAHPRGAAAGVDPRYMGIGPVPALRKLVNRTGVSLSEVSRFELNEAFAAQALSVLRELPELPDSLWQERVNVCGGAIALWPSLWLFGSAHRDDPGP